MNKPAVLIVFLFLSSCAGWLPSEEELAKQLLPDVTVYTSSELENMTYTRIEPIEATSCKNEVWDPEPSEKDAVNQLKEITAGMRGNGIAELKCEPAEEINYRRKCWNYIICHATAISVVEKTP